jgi:hypothetical protein
MFNKRYLRITPMCETTTPMHEAIAKHEDATPMQSGSTNVKS